MDLKENPELVNQGTVSYPIVWEPWNISILQDDYPSVPFASGQSYILWQPRDGRIYEVLSQQPYDRIRIRNEAEDYVKYNLPSPLLIPVGRPGKSLIEVTMQFQKAYSSTLYTNSVRTFGIGVPGTGYRVGDYFYQEATVIGGADAIWIVTAVNATGGVVSADLVQPGYGFTVRLAQPVINITGNGIGATISIDDIQNVPIWDHYHWALIQDEEIFPLRKDYEDDKGVYFYPVVINLERFQSDFNPSLAWLRTQNSNSTGTRGLVVRDNPYNYQWYLINTHYTSVILDYKVTYLPDGNLENGDISDVPITMASLTRMLNSRDRKRDKKKGRDITPAKTLLSRANNDLRRRRELNRPIGNAF